jgi:DNA-binding transcriptional ArsR family regulator
MARPAGAKAGDRAGKKDTTSPLSTADGAKAAKLRSERKASLAFLLSHPIRVQILAASHRAPISPSGFAREHDLKTTSVAEHFRKLAEYGAIKLLRKEPVRGSVRHLYVGTKRGVITAKDWESLPASVQSDIAAAGLSDFVVVTAEAIDRGSFHKRPDFVLTWDEAELDEIAWGKLTKMLKLLWTKVPALEEETEMRRERGSSGTMKAIVGLAAFEAPTPAEAEPDEADEPPPPVKRRARRTPKRSGKSR